jgi:hypothetical protein
MLPEDVLARAQLVSDWISEIRCSARSTDIYCSVLFSRTRGVRSTASLHQLTNLPGCQEGRLWSSHYHPVLQLDKSQQIRGHYPYWRFTATERSQPCLTSASHFCCFYLHLRVLHNLFRNVHIQFCSEVSIDPSMYVVRYRQPWTNCGTSACALSLTWSLGLGFKLLLLLLYYSFGRHTKCLCYVTISRF